MSKIYSRIVLDMASGEVLEADSFEYQGPLALAGGKPKTQTTKVQLPDPTPEELADRDLARQINMANLYESGYEMQDGKLQKRALTPDEQSQADFENQVTQKIRQQLLGQISPETRQLVANTYSAARNQGNRNIQQAMIEMAGQRGMDLKTDSPLMREMGNAQTNLESNLQGAESAALLDEGHRGQLFAQGLREFQAQLAQQAQINRMNAGLGFSNMANGMAQIRMAQPTTKMTMSGGPSPAGSIIGGMFQGAMAGGQMGGPWGALAGGVAGAGMGAASHYTNN